MAAYVAGVFGDEGERTVMHVPGLASLRKELASAPPPLPIPERLPPPVPDLPVQEDTEDVTRTEMARPLDLQAILGPKPTSVPGATPSLSSIGDLLDEQSSTLSTTGRDLPEASMTGTTAPSPFAASRKKRTPVPAELPVEPPTSRGRAQRQRRPNARNEDNESTTDYGTVTGTKTSLLTPHRIIVAAVGAAVFLILGAAIVRATRAPEPELEPGADAALTRPGSQSTGTQAAEPEGVDPDGAEPEGVEPQTVEPDGAGAPAATATDAADPKVLPETDRGASAAAIARTETVPVLFRAGKGTSIWSGDTRLVPGRTYQVVPGTLSVRWRCPNGKAGSSRFNIDGGHPGTLDLSSKCRRK